MKPTVSEGTLPVREVARFALTAEVKGRWLKALRTEGVLKCKGVLTDSRGACCALGWLGAVTDSLDGLYSWKGGSCMGIPSSAVRGLKLWHQDTIVRMNDTEDKPLSEIADWIEANIQPVED